MDAKILLEACEEAGIDFYTGVPDSQLKGLCDLLYARYGTESGKHTVAHNEGGAIGLCAGHFLATGRPALCYMQNSGLGNAVNPLASLMDPEVYCMPCLLVIGWRGEPGVHDEPQHRKQGAITLGQLELMGIPCRIISPETTEESFRKDFGELREELAKNRCAALVVRKGGLTTAEKPDYRNGNRMSREEAAEVLLTAGQEGDAWVCTTGKLSREVFEIRERAGQGHEKDFLTVGSMGHASMIAMQMALEQPGRRIWCLDGDGAAMMHLGALAMIGRRKPRNLIHVIIGNGAHETVGGIPIGDPEIPWIRIATELGYRKAVGAADPASLKEALTALRPEEGPVLIEVNCACGARKDLGRPTTTPIENRDALMAYLGVSETSTMSREK